jgi:hypothetical protein
MPTELSKKPPIFDAETILFHATSNNLVASFAPNPQNGHTRIADVNPPLISFHLTSY